MSIAFGGLGLSARAEAFVYWTNDFGLAHGGTIGRANLDGSGVDQSFITGAEGPCGVAVDGSHIYWTDARGGHGGTIGRANLDGSGVDHRFITGAKGPCGVDVDGSHIYWTDFAGGTIGRANLDGSGVDHRFITGARFPTGAEVDSEYVYWGNWSAIGRAKLDGSGVQRRFITGTLLPTDVTIHGSHIYWAESLSLIGRSKLNGARKRFLAPPNGVIGVTVDGAHFYWTSPSGGEVGRVNLDGSGADLHFIRCAHHSWGVAVDSLSAPPPPASNKFSFCTVKRNARRGTAKLTVQVPGSGGLVLEKSKKLKRAEKSVRSEGTVKLPVKARGRAKRRLKRRGVVRVKARVTYTPKGGKPNTRRKRLKLEKSRCPSPCSRRVGGEHSRARRPAADSILFSYAKGTPIRRTPRRTPYACASPSGRAHFHPARPHAGASSCAEWDRQRPRHP